jgi:hypothetical protein
MRESRKSARSVTAGREFDDLRARYFAELRDDRVELVALSAKLAHAGIDAAGTFTEIQLVAHRIRGAAALFEISSVRRAAGALEDAVLAALHGRARGSDPVVRKALETLIDKIA